MGALDRLENYSSRGHSLNVRKKDDINKVNSVFDTTKPQGNFLNKVHNMGYKMYNIFYSDGKDKITEEEYSDLPVGEKCKFVESVEYTELHDVLVTKGNQEINAIAGSGKALTNDTKVRTKKGYKKIKYLNVGDLVYAEDGRYYNVTGVFPQGSKKVYEITFDDGNKVKCCKEHLWSYFVADGGELITTTVLDMPLGAEIPLSKYLVRKKNSSDNYVKGAIAVLCSMTSDGLYDMDRMGETGRKYIRHLFKVKGKQPKEATLYNSIREHIFGVGSKRLRLHSLRVLCDEFNIQYNQPSKGLLLDCTNTLVAECVKRLADELGLFCVTDGLMVRLYDSSDICILDNSATITKDRRTVVKLRELDKFEDMTCISVNSPNRLFLIDNCIVTHNTTALIFKIMHDIVTGESKVRRQIADGTIIEVVNKVWVCTFLKTGATELEQSLISRQSEMGYLSTTGQMSISTLDAEFKRCLNSLGVITNIADSSTIRRLLHKAIDDCGIKRDGDALTAEDYQIIEGVVTYARGRLDSKRYNHPSAKEYGLFPVTMDTLLNTFASIRKSEGVMDFDEMQEVLYKYLYKTPNKKVQDFVSNRYNYIYVDEFQDTSQMQYAILKFYARGKLVVNKNSYEFVDTSVNPLYTGEVTKGKIVGIGDVSQCIYSFKGSDSTILAESFGKDFNPTVNRLSYNYRCPDNILNPIVKSIHLNEDSSHQSINSFNKGGEFSVNAFKTYGQMLEQLKRDIKKDINEGMTVAVLCRTNYDGMIPAFILESHGFDNFSISGSSMTMSSPLPRKLIGVASLFTERSTPAVSSALKQFSGRGNDFKVDQLVKALKMNNLSLWSVNEEDIKHSCPSLYNLVVNTKKETHPNGVRDRKAEVSALCKLYQSLMVTSYSGTSTYCESARAYIEVLLYILEDKEFNSVYEFLEEVDLINERLTGRIKRNKAKIRIATVHEFKGKECDSVYVWNDSKGIYPNAKTNMQSADQVAEERRVHYIACTRAKKREHIYTLLGKEGLFLKEMNVKATQPYTVSAILGKPRGDIKVEVPKSLDKEYVIKLRENETSKSELFNMTFDKFYFKYSNDTTEKVVLFSEVEACYCVDTGSSNKIVSIELNTGNNILFRSENECWDTLYSLFEASKYKADSVVW